MTHTTFNQWFCLRCASWCRIFFVCRFAAARMNIDINKRDFFAWREQGLDLCYRGHLIDMSTLYYLLSEFCLVVKISSNIVTENCRRIWFCLRWQSMFCLWFPAVSNARGTDPKSHRYTACGQLTANRRGRARVDIIIDVANLGYHFTHVHSLVQERVYRQIWHNHYLS